jgi:hypothetical protein
VDTRIWDQVGLELSDINVQGTIESQRGSQGRNDLGNESVQVGISGSLNIELSSADIVNSFVIEDNSDISVLQERVGRQDRVVWLNNGGGDLGGWVNGEAEFGLLSVIDGESFQQEGAESGSGTTSD